MPVDVNAEGIVKLLIENPIRAFFIGGSIFIGLAASGVALPKFFDQEVYATEASTNARFDDVYAYIDCSNAPANIRLIKMGLRDLKSEIEKYPDSNTLKNEIEEEGSALERLQSFHSSKCKR